MFTDLTKKAKRYIFLLKSNHDGQFRLASWSLEISRLSLMDIRIHRKATIKENIYV